MKTRIEPPDELLGAGGAGVTEISIANVKKYKSALGTVICVEHRQDWDEGISTTVVRGELADLVVSGFAVGYRGTGPSGLLATLQLLNLMDPEIDHHIEQAVYETDEQRVALVFKPGVVEMVEVR